MVLRPCPRGHLDCKLRYTKVIAYITRRNKTGAPELLVFDHDQVKYPDAGTQVPAGTVDEGETIEQGLLREIEEESGLRGCEIVTRLAVYEWEHPDTHNTHERHVYHLRAPETHLISGRGSKRAAEPFPNMKATFSFFAGSHYPSLSTWQGTRETTCICSIRNRRPVYSRPWRL